LRGVKLDNNEKKMKHLFNTKTKRILNQQRRLRHAAVSIKKQTWRANLLGFGQSAQTLTQIGLQKAARAGKVNGIMRSDDNLL